MLTQTIKPYGVFQQRSPFGFQTTTSIFDKTHHVFTWSRQEVDSYGEIPSKPQSISFSLLLGCFELSCPSKCQNECATPSFDVHEQPVVCLTSSSEVEDMLCALKHCKEIATGIDVLDVHQGAADGPTFKAVRAILGHARNISTLVDMPSASLGV
jgi:hypothetical protein